MPKYMAGYNIGSIRMVVSVIIKLALNFQLRWSFWLWRRWDYRPYSQNAVDEARDILRA
ncbi:MAG: hypothetical protein ACRD5B_03475 [Nitrososphaeraceae archaeon]